jgi:hypothetical protein
MNAFKFTSPVTIPKSDFSISHQHPILLLGSCFTESIGQKLLDNKFDVTINPNGIIYNPISVLNTLNRITTNQLYSEKELHQFNNKWISFNHHGDFSSFDKTDCLDKINTSITNAHFQIKNVKTLIITFGSAWVYEYKDKGIVANCHKIPNKEFKKRLLSVKEIINAFGDVFKNTTSINPNINIIFTVSPVRHINDGLHENNLSKSVLHLAINNIVKQNDYCSYFPSYELIIDELRDYRFFKDDLIHPTEMAVNYVWKKFSNCFFNEETKSLISEIQKIKAAANHKPFNFESNKHQQFIKNQIQNIDELTSKHPFLDFEKEKFEMIN